MIGRRTSLPLPVEPPSADGTGSARPTGRGVAGTGGGCWRRGGARRRRGDRRSGDGVGGDGDREGPGRALGVIIRRDVRWIRPCRRRCRAARPASRPSGCRPRDRPCPGDRRAAGVLDDQAAAVGRHRLAVDAGHLGDRLGDGRLVGRGRGLELGVRQDERRDQQSRQRGDEEERRKATDRDLQHHVASLQTFTEPCRGPVAATTEIPPMQIEYLEPAPGDYRPGACNIGPREIAKRRAFGIAGIVVVGRARHRPCRDRRAARSRGPSSSSRCGARSSASNRRAGSSAPGSPTRGSAASTARTPPNRSSIRADLARDRAAARWLVAYCGVIALAITAVFVLLPV